MKILVTIPDTDLRRMFFPEDSRRRLESLGSVTWNPHDRQLTRDELADLLSTTEVCVTGWHTEQITPELIAGGKLRCIAHVGGTVTEIVSEEIFSQPVAVINANDAFGKTVAELTLLLLLMGFRNIYAYIEKMRTEEGYWIPPHICNRELFGKTVGILGYGTISRELIRLLGPFETEILVYSKHCPVKTAESAGFALCGLDELLERSDAVVPLNTLTPETYHLLDAEHLAMMKDGALIANTGRGALIDEAALIGELRAGRLFAALDVYEHEPLGADSPLRALPNAICVPHMGGKTINCRNRMGSMVIEDIRRFAEGLPPLRQVTLDQYQRMTQKVSK